MAGQPTLEVYTFPYSHYGLKAEYLLGHKGLSYDRVIVPYTQALGLEAAVGYDEVPVLTVDGEACGWRQIPAVLDEIAPEPRLSPADPTAKRLAAALEDWADLDLGHRARRLAYGYLKDHPGEVPKAFGGGLKGALVGGTATLVSSLAYGVTGIVQDHDERALEAATGHLAGLLADHGNLVGKQTTSADIAVVALLDPVVRLEPLRRRFLDGYLLHWLEARREHLRDRAKAMRAETRSAKL